MWTTGKRILRQLRLRYQGDGGEDERRKRVNKNCESKASKRNSKRAMPEIPPKAYSNSLSVLAILLRRSSIRAKTVPASNLPTPFLLPAETLVKISIPCSILATGHT